MQGRFGKYVEVAIFESLDVPLHEMPLTVNHPREFEQKFGLRKPALPVVERKTARITLKDAHSQALSTRRSLPPIALFSHMPRMRLLILGSYCSSISSNG